MDENEELLAKIDVRESRIYELEEELESKDREVMNAEASISLRVVFPTPLMPRRTI